MQRKWRKEKPMIPVKRIELVMQQDAVKDVVTQLDALGVSGYTLVRDVLGRGERGLRAGIDLGAFQYNLVIVSCSAEQVDPIVQLMRPYLKRFGGMCLVSDAAWVIH
jgi:nitrogen regulatory protein PII